LTCPDVSSPGRGGGCARGVAQILDAERKAQRREKIAERIWREPNLRAALDRKAERGGAHQRMIGDHGKWLKRVEGERHGREMPRRPAEEILRFEARCQGQMRETQAAREAAKIMSPSA